MFQAGCSDMSVKRTHSSGRLVFYALDKELKSISVIPGESRGNTEKVKKSLQPQYIHH